MTVSDHLDVIAAQSDDEPRMGQEDFTAVLKAEIDERDAKGQKRKPARAGRNKP